MLYIKLFLLSFFLSFAVWGVNNLSDLREYANTFYPIYQQMKTLDAHAKQVFQNPQKLMDTCQVASDQSIYEYNFYKEIFFLKDGATIKKNMVKGDTKNYLGQYKPTCFSELKRIDSTYFEEAGVLHQRHRCKQSVAGTKQRFSFTVVFTKVLGSDDTISCRMGLTTGYVTMGHSKL